MLGLRRVVPGTVRVQLEGEPLVVLVDAFLDLFEPALTLEKRKPLNGLQLIRHDPQFGHDGANFDGISRYGHVSSRCILLRRYIGENAEREPTRRGGLGNDRSHRTRHPRGGCGHHNDHRDPRELHGQPIPAPSARFERELAVLSSPSLDLSSMQP